MLIFDVGRLTHATHQLAAFAQVLPAPEVRLQEAQLPRKNYDDIKAAIEFVYDEAQRLELGSSLITARTLKDIVQNECEHFTGKIGPYEGEIAKFPPLAAGRYRSYAIELQGRVRDDLSAKIVMTIPYGKAAFFDPANQPFGAKVGTQFPSAAFEIDEAAKCLALARPTAAVFHLMRTMECGLQAVRKSLGIPDPVKDAERNWGGILRKFKDEIDRRNAQKPQQWTLAGNKTFFEEIYVSIDAVRNVWRNATMHVESKYLIDEAEHIFNAVRGFMMKVSSRVDEQGQPLA